jgi:hypothetical protein
VHREIKRCVDEIISKENANVKDEANEKE